MKRLTMLVMAGAFGLLLTACGENAPKQPAATTDVVAEQPAAESSSAAPEASQDESAASSDAQTQE